jgi:beta-1,4-mannooligosaccharide/beta-1,4-mannosyl-N-acetylglucosamine phosphorylase
MSPKAGRDIIHRYEGNPLIAITGLPFRVSNIWNAGAARVGDQYLLLVTVETLRGVLCIYRATSRDGRHFAVDSEPFLTGEESGPLACYERFGIRDPRITHVDGTYYVTYVADSEQGQRIGLAKTSDFQQIEKLGLVTQPDTKNGALFPRKIGGRYAMLERPAAGVSIWISYSDDLTYWGSATVVMTPRGGFWDPTRIGAASPPIEMDTGWLLIYYGEKQTSAGPLVRLGAAILDREDPSRVLARSNIPILSPREHYERIGDVNNVIFSCGALLEDGNRLALYYGASNSCICLGTGTLDDIVRVCYESEEGH